MSRSAATVPGWWAAAIAALALFAVPLPAAFIERVYSRDVFVWWQGGITSVSNLAPFALLDVLILGVALAVIGRGVRLVRVAREGYPRAAAWEGLRRLVRASAVMGIVFLLMWGLNYRRIPLDRALPPARSLTVEDLRAAIVDANTLGARLRPLGSVNGPSIADITVRLPRAMNVALGRLGRPPLRTPGHPKYSRVLTPFFTAAGVDGMVDPFALETIVHPDLLPFERPFVVAHEWAHLAGAADEADASAIGWLACMSSAPDFAYSGAISLIVEAGSAMPRGAWRDVSARLDPGIRADLIALSQRQERQHPQVQRTAFHVYDGYLRANRVEDGVASYSRALSLMLSPALRGVLNEYRDDADRRP